jgi:carbonic anhydrase/SulP family sulfate permease
MIHGALLLVSVLLLPAWLNRIPIACLAAILFVTGIKLASPRLAKKTWDEGWNQFLPFITTVVAIILTNLATGVVIGLVTSVLFILHSNLRRPLRRTVEKHLSGDVLRIELANQVSFLNRAVLWKTLNDIQRGGNVLIDARSTDYIDPDVLSLLHDFKSNIGPARGVKVSLLGFKEKYHLRDEIQYVDYADRQTQSRLSPGEVLSILKQGNERFQQGRHLTRDLTRQVDATAGGQFPLAVVLSCIDSRAPAELIFDVGIGELFGARVAGNIITSRVVGSIEYGCAVAGAKVVLVMGHTRCGAVTAAIDLLHQGKTARETTGCTNLDAVISEIQKSIELPSLKQYESWSPEERSAFVDDIACRNVLRTIDQLHSESPVLHRLHEQQCIVIVGGLYDVCTGRMRFLHERSEEEAPASGDGKSWLTLRAADSLP